MHDTAVVRPSWREGVTRKQWRSLIAANLGWLFDGFETYALILTVGSVLRSLDPAAPQSSIAFLSGATIAVTLLGWGMGGILGGVFADYFGRRRTLLVAIVLYAVFTGLTAASWDLTSFLVLRFITGFALGSEWGTGASLVAEIWPSHARAKAAGLMQCGLGLGFFIASACWYFVAPIGPDAWRIMFLIGVLPAFFALWLRRSVPESERWTKADGRRRSLRERRGEDLSRDEVSYTRLTLRQIFADPELRRRTILGSLMSLTTTLGLVGHLHLGAALRLQHRRGVRRQRLGVGEWRRDDLQRRCDRRLHQLRLHRRPLRPQARDDDLLRGVPHPDPGALPLDA